MKKRPSSKTAPNGMFAGMTAETAAMAALAGTTTGMIDFLSVDVVSGGTFILLFTFLLGLKLPRLAWLWAIVIGGAVPVVWYAGIAFGFTPADAFAPPVAASIAIGPAIVGAYFGALTRHVGDHVRDFRAEKKK